MAEEIVQTFFERLASDWSYDASDLRTLWGAFRKDWRAAGEQLCKCLLVHIQAPQKYKGDKVVPSCVRDWVRNMPQDGEWKNLAPDIASKVVEQLSGWTGHQAKQSRERVLAILVEVLRGLPRDAELDSEISDNAIEHLRQHLRDKDDGVRELVIVALTKLVPIEEAAAKDNEVVAELIHALHTDVSQDVRAAVVQRLPLDASTLEDVLKHSRDGAAKVAAAVYDRMAQEVSMAQPSRGGGVAASLELRKTLMWEGLKESRPEVQKAAQGLLVKWFMEDAGGDVVRLMGAFGPQERPEVCSLMLEQLSVLQKWDAQAWLHQASVQGVSPKALVPIAEAAAAGDDGSGGAAGASWMAVVTPELAFVCVHACSLVEQMASSKGRLAATRVAAVVAKVEASEGAEAEAVMEAFLPTPQQMAQLCLHAAKAGPPHRYAAAQLMALAALPCMNWTDACGREAAEATLRSIIAHVARPGEEEASTSGRGYLPSAGASGSGAWETAVLRLATAVYGDRTRLVPGVLPMVLRLAEDLAVAGRAPEQAAEGPLLQVLTYLHLLMLAAGPSVPSTASAAVVPAWEGEEEGPERVTVSVSLAQAVDQLAWTAATGHSSPVVRAAAARCRVRLCLRDGGLAQLPRTVTMLAALLPAHHRNSASGAAAGAEPATKVAGGSRRRGGDAVAVADRDDAALQQQRHQHLPRRVALAGLIDLTLMWGELTVTAELASAEAALARNRRVEAVAEQLAALGMAGGGGSDEGGRGAEAAATDPMLPQSAHSVVNLLLRLTEGVVQKLQGSDSFLAARGCASDALLGMARMLQTWHTQRLVSANLRQQVVTTMQPHDAEKLLTRLLLARFSPAVEAEAALRSQLAAFFKGYQVSASEPGKDGAMLRRLLAGAFLHAARCAIALPAPPGAPTTARGCAAPALMEFAAELLVGAAAEAAGAAETAAAEAAEAEDEDWHVHGDHAASDDATAAAREAALAASVQEPAARDPVMQLCELVLQEVVGVAGPGGSALDTAEPKVKAYVSELCKTPLRLLPGLPRSTTAAPGPAHWATLGAIRRLVFLGRRAVAAAATDLVGTVVPDTAFKKLQEFVRSVEEMQQDNVAPLTEQDAAHIIQALTDRLGSLPGLNDVNAGAEADEEWDTDQAVAGDQRNQAGAGRRGAGRTKAATTAAPRGGKGRRAAGSQPATIAGRNPGGRSRRADTRIDDGDSDNDSGDNDNSSDNSGSEEDDEGAAGARARRAGKGAAAGGLEAVQGLSVAAPSQGERRSSRAAAAKAVAKLQDMRDRDAAAAARKTKKQ